MENQKYLSAIANISAARSKKRSIEAQIRQLHKQKRDLSAGTSLGYSEKRDILHDLLGNKHKSCLPYDAHTDSGSAILGIVNLDFGSSYLADRIPELDSYRSAVTAYNHALCELNAKKIEAVRSLVLLDQLAPISLDLKALEMYLLR